jgi:hypothetical protein
MSLLADLLLVLFQLCLQEQLRLPLLQGQPQVIDQDTIHANRSMSFTAIYYGRMVKCSYNYLFAKHSLRCASGVFLKTVLSHTLLCVG